MMILTFFHSLLLGMAFIDPLLVDFLVPGSSTDETLRPFSSINNHGNEDGIPNDSGLQHLESSMLNQFQPCCIGTQCQQQECYKYHNLEVVMM